MKIKLITLLVLSAVINGFAQNNIQSKAGIKLGYSLAAVSYNGDVETGQRHGFHAGVYGESFFSDVVALQVEFLYSQQGYTIKDNGGEFTQKLDYVNLPLLLKIYPSSNFFLEAGPQVGLAVNHKEEYDSNFNLFSTSKEFDPTNFDWGLNFGGGFKTESGISLGVRYHLGMGDIYDEGNPQNRVWLFSMGFDF